MLDCICQYLICTQQCSDTGGARRGRSPRHDADVGADALELVGGGGDVLGLADLREQLLGVGGQGVGRRRAASAARVEDPDEAAEQLLGRIAFSG